MSSMGDAWPDDGMDFPGSSTSQIPSIIPVPQDASAALVPFPAYTPAPVLQDPNTGMPLEDGAPSARGVGQALGWAGYFPDGAATAAENVARWSGGDKTALQALGDTTPYLALPLVAGSGVANTIADLHQGTSPADAIVGNIVRGGLVYGAGAGAGALTEGVGSIPASILADKYLPPAPVIGHAIVQGILNPPPLPNLYPAHDPASLEAFGE